jgi:hypothetical protein
VFEAEDLEEGFDFTNCHKTPCRIRGEGRMVYWENYVVENWKTGPGDQAPEFLKKIGKLRGKGILSTSESLTFIGNGGKAKND